MSAQVSNHYKPRIEGLQLHRLELILLPRPGYLPTSNSHHKKRPSTKILPLCMMVNMASSSSQTSQSSRNPPHPMPSIERQILTSIPSRDGVIKVCDEFPGFSRFKEHQPYGASSPMLISVPRSHAKHPTDTYPDSSEITIRKAIARFLPRFTSKDLFNRSMCWCTDTADANLLICEHPRWKNLIVATGDSG